MLPTHNDIKPTLKGISIVVFIVSYVVYGKRGKRIMSEYGKLKNQKLYIWLGAVFSAVTVSLPILMWLIFRAVL
jgi:hypothetical protein